MTANKEDRKKIENILLDLIENLHGDILLIFVHGLWMLPGGHLKFKETREAAVKREIKEEVRLGMNSTVRRQECLLEHEELARGDGHKIFRVFRSCYAGEDFESVIVPQKKEGIERVGWFSFQEITKMKLSKVASLAIKKLKKGEDSGNTKSLDDLWQGFSQRVREKLQIIFNEASFFLGNIKEKDRVLFERMEPIIENAGGLIGGISGAIREIDEEMKRYVSSKKEERRNAPVIAVIDDESETLNSLVGYLTQKEGFRVISFDDPKKALSGIRDIYRYKRGKIHSAIIDINMPGMRGDDLEGKIRAIDKEIKTIIISGYFNGSDEIRDRVLLKPFPLADLVKAIKKE